MRGEAAGPDNETQGTQAPATNTNMTNGQIPFQNPRGVPSTTGPTVSGGSRYSQPPNKGLGKKASKHSLPFQLYLHKPVHIPKAEI